jgi:DNA-binding NarL/FixJ family response regulator
MSNSNQKGVFYKLSQREFEVAYLIVSGKRTTDIANQLDLKTNTVSTIKRNIFYKMGVNTSIDLYILSLKEGIMSLPSLTV